MRAVGHRVERVLHQVVDHLAQLAGVTLDQRQSGLRFEVQPPCLLRAGIQRQHLAGQRIQVDRRQPRGRQPGVVSELVDEPLQRLDLVDDGADRAHQHRLVAALELALELVLQPLGGQLDRRQRILDLVRQAARDLAPGLAALRRHHLGDVVEYQQPGPVRHRRAAHQQGLSVARPALQVVGAQFERILPLVALTGIRRACMQLEALHHGRPELRQARHLVEPTPAVRQQRQAQDARRSRVDGIDPSLAVEDDHAGGQVVEDGLQVHARPLELGHAAVNQPARFRELLGHGCERPRQPAQLVARAEDRLARQVALGDLSHAFGQQQQRPRQLARQRNRQQQGTEDRQDQRQRQRADVHLAQPITGQCALLVFAVGRLHRQRIGGQQARQHLADIEVALLLRQVEARARDVRQCPDPRWRGRGSRRLGALCGPVRQRRAGGGIAAVVVEPLELAHHALQPGLAQQGRRRTLRRQTLGRRAAGAEQDLPTRPDDRNLLQRQLLAQPLDRQRLQLAAALAEPLGSQSGLLRQVVDLLVDGCPTEVQPGLERALHPDVEPALDAARDELEADGVDQHPRHHADEREDRRQLEQQPTAEAAARHPQQQPHRGDADHQHQQRGNDDIDPEQPHIVALVDNPVVGCQRQQEDEHEGSAGHRDQRNDPGPSGGFGHRSGLSDDAPAGLRPMGGAPCLSRSGTTSRSADPNRPDRPGRSATDAAAGRCRASN